MPSLEVEDTDDIQISGHRFPKQSIFYSSPSKVSTGVEPIIISSDEEIEAPPPKRQKIFAASPAVIKRKHPGPEPPAKKRRPFHIDLTFCDELMEGSPEDLPAGKKRRPGSNQRAFNKSGTHNKPRPPQNGAKANPILIDDSDDEKEETEDSDYDNLHAGYHIGWTTAPATSDEHILDLDVDEVEDAVARLCLNHIDPRIVRISRKLAPLTALEAAHCNWTTNFHYMGSSSFRRFIPSRLRGPIYASCHGGRSRTGLLKHRPLQLQSPLNTLALLSRVQMADGVQSISQSSKHVLVASSTPGGGAEDNENHSSRVDPYNSRNTLVLWTEDTKEHWLQSHYSPSLRKYYDVKCARFDPTNPNIIVSTGRDGSLVVWKYMKPDTNKSQRLDEMPSDPFLEDHVARYVPVKQWGTETYNGCCHDIVYRPQDRPSDPVLFASPCDNGKIFVHSYTQECTSFSPVQALQTSNHPSHKVGATIWGRHSTSKMLFVCSESEPAYHGAIDSVTGSLAYQFDQHESGEEMALDPAGSTLALFTTMEDELHFHLYDVARGYSRRTTSIILPPPSAQLHIHASPEVGVVSWSPDGLLLAVGCNDDVAHVYDVRCLERGPILTLAHETRSSSLGRPLLSLPEEERTESKSRYGITVLSWTLETCFKAPSMGLLTGGGDHCIALWDVKTACEERRVVAELDGHVGVAHFGDLSKGEKPLVAGDTDGHAYIFDFRESP